MWKKLYTKVLLRHSRLTVVEDDVELPNGRQIKYLRFVNSGDAAMVICIKDNSLLVQREYSYPAAKDLYQFPGGHIEAGESPSQAATRELLEESNLNANSITKLGEFYTNNRRSNATMHVFIVQKATPDKSTPDAEEFIESIWLPITEFNTLIASGDITNSTMLAAWALYQNRDKNK
ncbi:MAG TPA: NUDIX hydrolase [Candidatus Saccharimonas sp.]|nr:NUDIX hydrolase [Candidatus Saccharimonas sp.]